MDHDSRTGYINVIEASLYYLQSRYYNPEIGRFINADSYTSTGSLLGNNMFAYCLNNPVMHSDATGDSPFLALIADAGVSGLVNGLVSAICTFATGGSFADVAKSFFIGFGEGFIADILNLEILFAVMGGLQNSV